MTKKVVKVFVTLAAVLLLNFLVALIGTLVVFLLWPCMSELVPIMPNRLEFWTIAGGLFGFRMATQALIGKVNYKVEN